MGVPGFFSWLIKNTYIKDYITKNINNINNFYIDANCLFHPICNLSYKQYKDYEDYEDLMIQDIIIYIKFMIKLVNPKDLVFISVDGLAPMSKIIQQRERRFKTIYDRNNKEINDEWDNIKLTPGTEFMEKLHLELIKFIKKKTFVNIIYSSYHTIGEGETKIFNHIKKKIPLRTVIYGMDSDLIFLSLLINNEIYILREDNSDKNKENDKELMFIPLEYVKISINQKIIENISFKLKKNISFINDFVFIMFFLGNDFLPSFPTTSVYIDGINNLINCYINTINTIKKKLIYNNKINGLFFLEFFRNLRNQENYKIKKIWYNECKKKSIYKPFTKYRYYNYFIKNSRIDICENYFEMIIWTFNYYYNNICNWYKFYKFNYAPLIDDFYNYIFDNIDVLIEKNLKIDNSKPSYTIFDQLTLVLHYNSYYLLPKSIYKNLLKNNLYKINSPRDFIFNKFLKKFTWLYTPKLPILNYEIFFNINKDCVLTEEEKNRNKSLKNFLKINISN